MSSYSSLVYVSKNGDHIDEHKKVNTWLGPSEDTGDQWWTVDPLLEAEHTRPNQAESKICVSQNWKPVSTQYTSTAKHTGENVQLNTAPIVGFNHLVYFCSQPTQT